MTNRDYFRLRFPPSAALAFTTGEDKYVVCELSEGGLRIVCDGDSKIRIGQLVAGTLMMTNGERIDVKGFALRKDHEELVISQVDGITFELMMTEQRYVVQKFPNVAAPPQVNGMPPTAV